VEFGGTWAVRIAYGDKDAHKQSAEKSLLALSALIRSS